MRRFDSIGAFTQFMAGQISTLPVVEHEALEHVGKMVEDEAKRIIGTYEYGWPPLAESTKTDRVRKGFPEDEPLLRTGGTRSSIEHKVVRRTAQIGSDSEIAKHQELGTAKIPPRPFLSGALMHKEHEAVHLIGLSLAAHLAGKSREHP